MCACRVDDQVPVAAQRARDIIHSLRRSTSLKCFSAVAKDGVLRQFDSRGNVIDYRRLSPNEIEDFVELWVYRSDESKREYIREQYYGADGRNVGSEACLKPATEILPPGLLDNVEVKETLR